MNLTSCISHTGSVQKLKNKLSPKHRKSGELAKIRRRAYRRGVWCKVLSCMERGALNLVIRLVDVVRSTRLAQLVEGIIAKLSEALESRLSRMTREIGLPEAKRRGYLAFVWGNRQALNWALDRKYAQYLAVTNMNTPKMYLNSDLI